MIQIDRPPPPPTPAPSGKVYERAVNHGRCYYCGAPAIGQTWGTWRCKSHWPKAGG